MTSSGFCQGIYPKVVTIDNQQVVAITLSQMDSINSSFIWNEQLHTINDTLTRRLDSAYIAFRLFHQSDSAMRVQLSLRNSAIVERDTVIAGQMAVIRHQERQIVRLRWHKVLIGTGGIILTVVTLLLLH